MPNIIQVITRDSKVYQVEVQLLKRYSKFFEVMIDHEGEESEKVGQIKLEHVGQQAFDYIFEFFQLHRIKAPVTISKPVIKGVPLNVVMAEEDAELMERICTLPTQTKVQIINGASYLRIQTFKTLLTYALMQKQLQQPLPQLSSNPTLQEQIKAQIQSRINSLIEMENHIKRLQAEDFKQSQQKQDF